MPDPETPGAVLDQGRRDDLLEAQLAALFDVSRVLSRSLELRDTLREVLRTLHEHKRMCLGLVSLLDADSGDLLISALHNDDAAPFEKVRYRPGEGLIGYILETNERWILPRLGDEPRFLDRLNMFDPGLPFIGVPIRIGEDSVAGVFAVQPPAADQLLQQRARFAEMVANLIGQAVLLSRSVEAERRALREERDSLRRHLKGSHGFDSIIGHTQRIRIVFEQVRQVAKWNTTVLLRGESGTGKELIANAIHYNSPRAPGAFVKLNCAALPDNLLESELFGHEKGAFTGADARRIGRFEQADGGTLFLDEIGDMSPALQTRLLRVLAESEFYRVGGQRSIRVDVRVIAATNQNLARAVKEARFREDLYHRLNVIRINTPPLRQRREDIALLINHYLAKAADELRTSPKAIDGEALEVLEAYDWPGNVRQLVNATRRLTVTAPGSVITAEDIPPDFGGQEVGDRKTSEWTQSLESWAVQSLSNGETPLLDTALPEFERVLIRTAMARTKGHRQAAAKLLGWGRNTLARKMKALHLD